MPKPIRAGRRVWFAAWAVLCAAGVAATAALNASSVPPPPPEKPVSAECAQYIAEIDRQLAEARKKGDGDGELAFARLRAGTGDDCDEQLREHLGGDG